MTNINTHTAAECTPLLISGGAEIDKLFLQILLRLVMKPFKAQPELQKLKGANFTLLRP